MVDGCSDTKDIAEAFRVSFESNSKPNNVDKVNDLNQRFSEVYSKFSSNHNDSCNCSQYTVSLTTVIDAIGCLKNGKCADSDGIHAEHLHHAPLNFLERLTHLFNAMLCHSHVPTQFRFGHMIPIIKDTQGNSGDSSNYRGITISPTLSKLFEHVLKIVFAEHLNTSPNQFGFKKRHSTSHAIHCLKETVDYYINNGSNVYCSFLDASKAFDRLVHSGLFLKLINRGFPKVFIDIVITWYDGLYCRVLWNGSYSEWFNVTAGVRQGGVLSPDFYGLYVDELFHILESSGTGCYFLNRFAAALMYADDMALIAPSLKGLQTLLSLCERYCIDWDIKLNAKKSKNLSFGKGASPSHRLTLNSSPIDWVDKWKYLGVTLIHGRRFSCCVEETLKKFYRSLNSILRVDGQSDDIIMLRLIESHCVPVLSYAIEVINISDKKQSSKMRVAYNAIFRKLFNYSYRESVTDLQHMLCRPTWEELIEKRKGSFLKKISLLPNDSLARAICS